VFSFVRCGFALPSIDVNRIRLLPEQVANQIAAGEVVERPASVVKELVENSLDAGASRIHVEVQAGGRSLIRVTDDGVGMSRDDALLCLERHATSKIKQAEDLAAITTMGFRGEALPSIASVSRFTLTTRERESGSPEGTQVIVTGGKINDVKAAGSAPGSVVEVRQLFFNLPARRKFLRSEETESGHVQHYLTLAALAHPEVSFTFQKDGRTIWQLPSVRKGESELDRLNALRERLRALYGDEQKLLPVNFASVLAAAGDGSEDDVPRQFRVWGFIGAPGVSRATREDQHVFVNRRPVENRGLNYALLEGYHTSLMKGRYPVCCLFLEMNPASVDVNIHPAKREVKFHRERDVRHLVAQAVRETLLKFHSGEAGPHIPVDPKPVPVSPVQAESSENAPVVAQKVLPNLPEELVPPSVAPRRSTTQPTLPMGFARPDSGQAATSSASVTPAKQEPRPAEIAVEPQAQPQNEQPPPSAQPAQVEVNSGRLLSVPLRLIGVVGRLYVLLESDRGLVLLVQHAAHERILYEQMLDRLQRQGRAPSQKLLLPSTVELSARDAVFLREQLTTLTKLGVGLSEFGDRTFLLDALPPFVKASDPRRFVLELIDQLKAAGQEVNALRLGEHVVAKTVCRHAVKANDPLSTPELEKLVETLRHCAMPYTCPHGRPTLIEMSFRELEKKFGRVQ
jgi:DNA mismatch repair protein MutL